MGLETWVNLDFLAAEEEREVSKQSPHLQVSYGVNHVPIMVVYLLFTKKDSCSVSSNIGIKQNDYRSTTYIHWTHETEQGFRKSTTLIPIKLSHPDPEVDTWQPPHVFEWVLVSPEPSQELAWHNDIIARLKNKNLKPNLQTWFLDFLTFGNLSKIRQSFIC